MIKIVTKKDGAVVLNGRAKASTILSEILDLAEKEVGSGFADYAVVYVDGEIYAEYES